MILKTVGSSIIGRKVTLDTICLRMDRISAWISSSGLVETASLVTDPVMSGPSEATVQGAHLASVPSPSSVWTRLMSKTHRSSGVRVSFEIMARTSWVMDPVSNHSGTHPSCSSSTTLGGDQRLTLNLFQYSMSLLIKIKARPNG